MVSPPDPLDYEGLLGEVLAPPHLERLKDSVSEKDFGLPDLPLCLGDLERGEDDPCCLFGVGREGVSVTTCKTLILGQELSCWDMNWVALCTNSGGR